MIIFDWVIIFVPSVVFILTKNKILSLVVLLFLIKFMYSPDKSNIDFKTDFFYSPSEGYISNIIEDNNYITVSLFLNIFDNHTQYAPIKSVLKSRNHVYGAFVPAYSEHAINNTRIKSDLYNPDYNFSYSISQITGILTRRIKTFDKQIFLPGDRLGFIIFGSRVDVTVPKTNILEILVKSGDHIKELTPLFKIK